MPASPGITREIDVMGGRHTPEKRRFAARTTGVRPAKVFHIFEVPLEGFGIFPYQYHFFTCLTLITILEIAHKHIKKVLSSLTK